MSRWAINDAEQVALQKLQLRPKRDCSQLFLQDRCIQFVDRRDRLHELLPVRSAFGHLEVAAGTCLLEIQDLVGEFIPASMGCGILLFYHAQQ